MFEDVCLVCSRPVQDMSSTYCSDECAAQDVLSVPSTSDDRSSTSSVSSAPSPYLRPTTKPSFGPFGLTSPDVDPPSLLAAHLALHNPHPTFNDYPLPIQISPPVLATYSKPSAKYSPSAHHQRLHVQRHMRKRSSLSSSSASSALSTPSQPSLTDDDDSMSDPEFQLDVNVHVAPRPVIDYARRPSTTNTRSTVSHLNPSSSSASSSVGGYERERTRSRPRHHQRPRHAHHLSAPLVGTAAASAQALHSEDYDSLFAEDDNSSNHAYTHEDNGNVDLEASYATLTKLSLAAHDGATAHTSSSFGIDTVRQKKRRSALSLRPRSSLPAYFNLLKMSSPPAGRDPTPSPSPPQADCVSQDATEGSFSSPGSTRTARVSRSATRPAPQNHVRQPSKTQSTLGGTSPNLHPNLHVRAEPVSSISALHSFGAVYGVNKGVSTSAALKAAKVAARGQGNALAAAAALVPLPTTPTSPRDVGPTAAHPDALEVDKVDARSHPLLTRTSAAASIGFAAAEGTPRGRTRSRSACPRSRSRSRSRSRRGRGHFGAFAGAREDGEGDALVASVAAALGYATRGRAHARGIGGRARRGRRGTGTVMPAFGSDGDEELAAEDVWFAGGYTGPGPRSSAPKDVESEDVATQLRGRRRGMGVPVQA
ncbi:hypothetical protein SCHPADRAFT_942756 [Schizopora paradoxa]|uniref:Uncharacterized protein n=1 Tax=Schizopora paradoxa TaxID=27342 RepID=A0A0H2S0L3_9AGAM|nr:hypothetical protein SCHPADRAFT_942756 [Schizopora paradoxa]